MMADASRGLRFKNKVAIVTGGCAGIGRGCVDVLGMYMISLNISLVFYVMTNIKHMF